MITIITWFDHHAGAGTWLAAAATFMTVVVAVCIAISGSRQEAKRQYKEKNATDRAIITGLGNSLGWIDAMYRDFESHPNRDVAIVSFSIGMNSAIKSVEYVLTQRFSDEELLIISLDTLSTLEAVDTAVQKQKYDGVRVIKGYKLREIIQPFQSILKDYHTRVQRRVTVAGVRIPPPPQVPGSESDPPPSAIEP